MYFPQYVICFILIQTLQERQRVTLSIQHSINQHIIGCLASELTRLHFVCWQRSISNIRDCGVHPSVLHFYLILSYCYLILIKVLTLIGIDLDIFASDVSTIPSKISSCLFYTLKICSMSNSWNFIIISLTFFKYDSIFSLLA